MAKTLISDVIVPEIFVPYVINRSAELSALVRSGIVVNDASMDTLASGAGQTFNMPFWNDLSGADEVLSDSSALTVNNITANQDIAVKLMRGKAWSSNDLAGALAGSDPQMAIGDLVAEWWVRREQDTLISILKGVFADNLANDSGDHIYDITVATNDQADVTDANRISATAVLMATQLLGDAQSALTAISCHSVIYTRLQLQNLIDFEPTNTQNVGWGTYLGKSVIVDDRHPTTAITGGFEYTSYLFGRGAIARGVGTISEASETDRDILAGDDILTNRRHFILHPRGIKFTSASVAGSSPTNTELEAEANWDRVYESKQMRLVALITND